MYPYRGMVQINVQVTRDYGQQINLRYAIDEAQSREMYPGRVPFSPWEVAHWQRANDRAEALAKAIATDLSHKILQMCDPDFKPSQVAKGEAA